MRALELLARWRRIAGAHLPLAGMGCAACGFGAGGVSVQDFEVPILDYLHGRHGRDPALQVFFDAAGHVAGRSGQLAELLAAVARTQDPGVSADALLDDLARSVASFAQAHAPG